MRECMWYTAVYGMSNKRTTEMPGEVQQNGEITG